MNIDLNLIPDTFQHKLRQLRLVQQLKRVGIGILAYLLLLSVIILGARFFLESQHRRIRAETALVSTENKKIESSVQDFNTAVAKASRIQNDALPWSDFVLRLSEAVPPGVRLNSINAAVDGTSSISGRADTRTNLLTLQQQLKSVAGVSEVTLPGASLLSKENIDFTITFHLALEYDTP